MADATCIVGEVELFSVSDFYLKPGKVLSPVCNLPWLWSVMSYWIYVIPSCDLLYLQSDMPQYDCNIIKCKVITLKHCYFCLMYPIRYNARCLMIRCWEDKVTPLVYIPVANFLGSLEVQMLVQVEQPFARRSVFILLWIHCF